MNNGYINPIGNRPDTFDNNADATKHIEPVETVAVPVREPEFVKEIEPTIKENTIEEVDSKLNEVDPDGKAIDAVILPSATYNDIYKAMKIMDETTSEDDVDNFTSKEALAVGIAADGIRVTVKQNTLVKALNNKEADWMQKPTYADKALTIRELAVGKGGKGGVIKGSAASAKFYSYLGLGGIIQIPLWHSGFWISLKAIKESELLNLEMMIAENQIRLGRETNTLIYSNYSVVFNRIVLEFITRHIQSCTLDIDNLNDITKYIKMQDLYPLVNGLIQSIYVKGFKDVRTCVNSLNINPTTNKPECDFTLESIIDPKKLLWVNRKELSTEHMKIMVKRSPKSVTLDEVLEYQATLNVNKIKAHTIPTENEMDVIVNIKTPTLKEHIESGELWVNNIITLTEKLFTEDISVTEKNKRVNSSSKMVLLSAYNHFISSIETVDGSIVKAKADIDEVLEILISDKIAFKAILNALRDYIDLNTIAIVGIPKYKCPNCTTKQGEDSITPDAFKDIIPINVLEAFFDLSILKTSKISERDLEELI